MLVGGEEGHLPSDGHGHVFHSFAACFDVSFALKFFKDLFGAVYDWTWDTGKLCDMHAVASIGTARYDLA